MVKYNRFLAKQSHLALTENVFYCFFSNTDTGNPWWSKKLSKYKTPEKNSSNSNTTPSKECRKDETIRRTKTLRKHMGKKPGGQSGHEGSTLKMTDQLDVKVNVSPYYCSRCGAALEDCERILDYMTQEVSVPNLKSIVKKYATILRSANNARVGVCLIPPASAAPIPFSMTRQ